MEKYEGYKFAPKQFLLGVQFLFVAFGALVLMPMLTGLDVSVALFTAGLGTIAFQIVSRKCVPPIFLASSFAFIAPIKYSVEKWGIGATMFATVCVGAFYIILSLIVRIKGSDFIHKLLPPIVVGPVIMSIGLILSPSAIDMAVGKGLEGVSKNEALLVSGASLLGCVLAITFGKKIISLIPILCGITFGYIVALMFGMVDFAGILSASWISVPNFTFAKVSDFNINAILFMLPVAIAPTIEHIGNIVAISNITKHDFIKTPGLKTTLFGDGIATSLASFFGGPPNTTYSEVTGAVKITKMFNPCIMTFAAITSILLAFVGKLNAFIHSIPTPVIGGIMVLLFGVIASIGMESLIKNKINLSNPRNMIIISLILVSALGGLEISFGFISLSGISLGAIVGVILNLILPKGESLDEIEQGLNQENIKED